MKSSRAGIPTYNTRFCPYPVKSKIGENLGKTRDKAIGEM